MKSRGMHPNAPITVLMSPEKGNMAATVVAMTTDNDRKTNLGIVLRTENCSIFRSANLRSSTSFVGCKQT
ncbi:hypothetical protein TIFTF001_036140 [Ficus carica]|uniref:Uncharacterized protein n=1 Tax=Ficus carica TaxID=3494 RepID=A0AA88E3Q6_FICCA|nr:hypothetical protein TIFTF001_036140 [Ficus carica]